MKFRRLRKTEPCPICANNHGCSISPDGEVIMCLRVEAGSFKACKQGMGWLHRIVERPKDQPIRRVVIKAPEPVKLPMERTFDQIASEAQSAMTDALWCELCGLLGLERSSLERMGSGYIKTYIHREPGMRPYPINDIWTWPMFDGDGKVIGIRTRTRKTPAEKKSLPGSRNGLFIPSGLDWTVNTDWYLPEGPTSCAAAIQMGLAAIGRPNNRAGSDLFIAMLNRYAGKRRVRVCVVSDDDRPHTLPNGTIYHPGQDGGRSFANEIVGYAKEVKVMVTPKPSFRPMPDYHGKDLRDFVCSGVPGLPSRFALASRMTPPLPSRSSAPMGMSYLPA